MKLSNNSSNSSNDSISRSLVGSSKTNRFAGILIGVFLLDFLLLMQPQLNTLNKINPKIKLVREDIKKAEDTRARIEHYRSEVKRFEGELNAISSKAP